MSNRGRTTQFGSVETMRRNGVWQEFKTPAGKRYFYNKDTKESRWDKPDFKKASGPQNSAKGAQAERKPMFALELIDDWHLIICNDGAKFYYNGESNTSKYEIDEEGAGQCAALIKSLDKEKLILLIGIARGYNVREGDVDRIFESLNEEIDLFKKNQVKVEKEDEPNEEAGDAETPPQANSAGLVSGYGSSSEEEPENDDAGIIDDLNQIDSGDVNERGLFFQLFDRYELDKFSTWSLQCKKIENDPDFYKIGDAAVRESLFEEWCASASESEDDTDADADADVLEPTKFHYLAQIVAKAEIAPDCIPQDIRTQQKALFKAYRVKEYVPSKRDQDRFVSQLLFYYKTFSLEQRREIFQECLRDHERDFACAVQLLRQDVGLISRWQALFPPAAADGASVEDALLSIEHRCGVGAIALTEPRYYVLGILDKTAGWVRWLAAEGGPRSRVAPAGAGPWPWPINPE
ncbi:hypothetical protein SUVZ_16G4180 [Saccharomyces uvarum]|uniref:WW domain-containing protein n=1 Tax=Saccharomyces uvarum TaxID=230603 RepID=A0ABN8WMD8_SACUV|nr:hypothetical protein SUVZ_16G4180 [Saccharomyces uvarum]